MKRFVWVTVILYFVINGVGTWLLWDFAYHNEDLTLQNERVFEETVRMKHPNVSLCWLPRHISMAVDLQWWKGQVEKRGRSDTRFVESPEEFASYLSVTSPCIFALRPYTNSAYTGDRAYLGYASENQELFVVYHEKYDIPGWNLKSVTDEKISYNLNNSSWVLVFMFAMWLVTYGIFGSALIIRAHYAYAQKKGGEEGND